MPSASQSVSGSGTGSLLLTPAVRPAPAFPRFAPVIVALSVLANALLAGRPWPLRFAVGGAAVVACWSMASWLEARVHRRLARRGAFARLAWSLLSPPLVLVAGIPVAGIAGALGEAIGDGGTLGLALFAGVWWFALATVGTTIVQLLDALASGVVGDFRSRILLSVLGLLMVVAALAAGAASAALDVVGGLTGAGPSSIPVTIRIDGETIAQGRQIVSPENGGTLAVLLLCVAAVISLPALLSACAKLADAVMDRLHPLVLGFREVAEGNLEVRVEEGGSREFVEVSRSFNAMAGALAMGRRMERAFGTYLGKQVMERIRAQHGEAELPAALREASVLFADIRGFTAMSEKLEPEQVLAVLNRYFARVVEVIDAHEGLLNKFIGDAVVVVFNGPLDQPDHAARAARCALAMQQAVAEMNAEGLFAEVGGLSIGVGIASGPVVAGNLGSSKQMEYTVIGDTVNLASRLTSKAPAGEVWASERTARALPTDLEAAALEAIVVKGKELPVVPHRLSLRPPQVQVPSNGVSNA